jgi:hypothetical protein
MFPFSCTYDELAPKKVEVPSVISFSADVIPIFNANCNVAGCHASGGQPPNLSQTNAYSSLTFYGYVDTIDPTASLIYEEISTGKMKQHATDQDRAIILKWIEQGAENN